MNHIVYQNACLLSRDEGVFINDRDIGQFFAQGNSFRE